VLDNLAIEETRARIAVLHVDRVAGPDLEHVDLYPRLDLDQITLVVPIDEGRRIVGQGKRLECLAIDRQCALTIGCDELSSARDHEGRNQPRNEQKPEDSYQPFQHLDLHFLSCLRR